MFLKCKFDSANSEKLAASHDSPQELRSIQYQIEITGLEENTIMLQCTLIQGASETFRFLVTKLRDSIDAKEMKK